MNILTGTYECKSDAKGRIMVSAGLKKQLENVLFDGFVLKRSISQPCLELYPKAVWEEQVNKLLKLNRFVKKNNDFIRLFMAGVKNIEIDASGRLLLPKDLLAFSKIKKDVVLSSSISIVEIWDKELYEKVVDIEVEDFADMAEQVMGGLNIEENGIS